MIGITVPLGWRAALNEQDSNLSRAVCVAIAKYYRWEYDVVNRVVPMWRLDVVTSLRKSQVVNELWDSIDVTVGRVETSTMSPMRVILTNRKTGETSEPLASIDRRPIVKRAKEIEKLIKAAS